MTPSDTLAAVDLGSNSFRLEIARVVGDQLYPLDTLKETVRLAGGLDAQKRLDADAQARALACLQRFGERLRGMPADAVRCVGTSTLRIAKNADVFIRLAEAALGHPIEVVAGREEARLIYLGVAHALPASPTRRLVVDIGGGSTELIIGHGLAPHERESLHMGCVNYTRRFFADGRIDKAALKAAETAARVEVERVGREFARNNWQQAIGSSGTARALAAVLEQSGGSARGISAGGLAELRARLVRAGSADALDLPGLSRDRRPVFAGGFAIMAALFAELGIEQMDVAETAMREGILYDLLGRVQQHDMRETTVAEFARRYHVDLQQAARVKRIALNLHGAAGSHDPRDARLLAWAATLHEIGLSVSHAGHHRHAGYILEHADMPGFSRTEQARLALLARAQRGALTKIEVFAKGTVAPADRLLAWALRQAVLVCRNRAEPHLGEAHVDATDDAFGLALPGDWLADRPLTRRALDDEAAAWQAVGVRYRLLQP